MVLGAASPQGQLLVCLQSVAEPVRPPAQAAIAARSMEQAKVEATSLGPADQAAASTNGIGHDSEALDGDSVDEPGPLPKTSHEQRKQVCSPHPAPHLEPC